MNQTLLKINHLHKEFNGKTILDDISLEVDQGDVVVIIGPSGCGKSTFLRCLNGLEEIQGGEVLLDGNPVSKKASDVSLMRQKIGMVFQSYDLFPHKTIIDNVMLAPLKVQKRNKDEVEQEAMELLERVGLADRRDDYPRQLSGGQKQRIAIVRALMMKPEILLLDEITAALDPEMVHEVLEVVLDLARNGSTMLIVTHEMAFAKAVANRVLFIDQGGIAEESHDPKAFFEMPKTERARQFLHSFEY